MKKNYAIIENEEFALINLRQSIQRLRPDYQLVFTAESVEECIEYFSANPDVDIAFMDIELTDANIFKLFEVVDVKVPIIFTTAYNDFALKAFKVNSIDYLLKPITDDDLESAITKYENVMATPVPDYHHLSQLLSAKPTRKRILINVGDNYTFVDIDDVAYFMREDKYVYAVLHDGKHRITDFHNLSEVTDVVDPLQFFLISRNIVASISSIAKISKWFSGRLNVCIKADTKEQNVVVSSARKKEFLDWIGGKV